MIKIMDKMTHAKFNLNTFLMVLSTPLDRTINKNINNISYDSRRVAYSSLRLASMLGLDNSYVADLFSYAILYKNKIMQKNISLFPFENNDVTQHLELKAILDLAVEIENNIKIEDNIIVNKREIIAFIKSDNALEENLKSTFLLLSEDISYWLDLTSESQLPFYIFRYLQDFTKEIEYDVLIKMSEVFSKLASEYSSNSYNPLIVEKLTQMCELYSMDNKDKSRMIISFYLASIGKLFISEELFVKMDTLEEYEEDLFKSIPYFTNSILQQIDGFDDINKLSATCYEQLDGNGYPYKLRANNLSLKNRLLSIVIIYKALVEKKRYRDAFSHDEAIVLLNEYANVGKLDQTIINDFAKIF